MAAEVVQLAGRVEGIGVTFCKSECLLRVAALVAGKSEGWSFSARSITLSIFMNIDSSA